MCGIAGILSFDRRPVAVERLARMTDAMVHRGPDDEGFYVGAGAGLAMRRLSIIDLDGGRQPIANEDGTVWVVLNGEIYNYRELRRELEGRGHRFRTQSDTEVIVHLYEERGAACVEALRGMFGFAVWDERTATLLLARDRLGIKPLYYARRADALVFASELKAILALGEAPLEIEWTALDHLLSFMTTPPDQSIVAGVRKLEPAHVLLANAAGRCDIRRYWRLAFVPDERRSEGEWIEALRAALAESVSLHCRSDVPLGAFLSGGVDSSAVVAATARQQAEPIHTFSIGFREAEYDEREYARLVSQACRTRHHEAIAEPDVAQALDDIAWHLDEPFGDSSAIPTFLVSRLAAREVTVALSGDGGDEVFAGYDRYRVERGERRYRYLPRLLRGLAGRIGERLPEGATGREFLRHLALDGPQRYLDAGSLFRADQKQRLLDPAVSSAIAGYDAREPALRSLGAHDEHWLSAIQRLDLEIYMPLDILTKVDRMSMAHSLEARVPLLDHVLVELAARIPARLQLRGDRGKHIFKRALAGWVPPVVLERRKRGFAIPLGHWFRGDLGRRLDDLLLSRRSAERGIWRPEYVADLLRRHRAGRALDLELWTLASFELWCRSFVDRAASVVGPSEAVVARRRAAVAGGAR